MVSSVRNYTDDTTSLDLTAKQLSSGPKTGQKRGIKVH